MAGAAPQRRAFCGRRLPFYDHYTLHDVNEVTPGVPFAWVRDERGFAVPELRVSQAAYEALHAIGARQERCEGTRGLRIPAARVQLLRELREIPPPNDIAIRAGWIVNRAQERSDRK